MKYHRHNKTTNQTKALLIKVVRLLLLESIIFLISLFTLSTLITRSKQQETKQLQEASQLLPRLRAKDKSSILFLLTKDTLLHTKQVKNFNNIYLSNIFVFSNTKPNPSILLKGNAQLKDKKVEQIGTNFYKITAYIKPKSNFYPKLLEVIYKDANLFIPFISPSQNQKNCIKNSTQKIYFMPGINKYLILTTKSKNNLVKEMPYVYYFCNNKFILEKNNITNTIKWNKLYDNSRLTIFSTSNWLKIQIKTQKPIYLLLANTKLLANNINIFPYLFFYENNNNKFIYIKKSDIYNLTATKNIKLTGTIDNQNFSLIIKNPKYIKIFNLILTKNQLVFILATTTFFIFNLILIKEYNQSSKVTNKKHV